MAHRVADEPVMTAATAAADKHRAVQLTGRSPIAITVMA
ncbi:unnamed protein product [Strongylus vulgaris]|uniref:Uncharacterized protein n=1 Tax=Strongylus vulgaris TaxID=40348 RepID=A0A3P7JVF1_STRVU|nr:unnamed protein product [Strongylus vulgaris]